MRYDHWKPYVPVAERRAQAQRKMKKMEKKLGITAQPIEIQGRKIAKSFWGASWCAHLESFADFANRLERGRTYARNGSICHLEIQGCEVKAMVSGSEIYNVKVEIGTLSQKEWEDVKSECTGQVSSMLSLLQGVLPARVLETVTNQEKGLFPSPKQIHFSCDCPDYATMCKHVAAVLYGIGARLDHQPELLFSLRGVDHTELITKEIDLTQKEPKGRRRLADDDLSEVFGVEMTESLPPRRPSTTKKTVKKTVKKETRKTAKIKVEQPSAHFTAEGVRALREKFGMTPLEFSILLGVNVQTVRNWDKKSGKLSLRKHPQEALLCASSYRKGQAWKILQEARIIEH